MIFKVKRHVACLCYVYFFNFFMFTQILILLYFVGTMS